MKKQAKRIAVFRQNGLLLAEFASVPEAARVLDLPVDHIIQALEGEREDVTPRRKRLVTQFGILKVREIDARTKGAC